MTFGAPVPPAPSSKLLLRVGDVLARQHGVVVQHEEAVGRELRDLALAVFFGARLDDDRARVHTHRDRVRFGGRFVAFGVEVLFGFRRRAGLAAALAEHLFVLCVEQVPAAVDAAAALRRRAARGPGRVVGAKDRRPFGGALDRLVLEQPELGGARVGAAGGRRFGRRRLAFGADHVRLPVVEEQLRGLADLFLGARRVAHVRQGDGDFVFARALDFRLCDADLVDALAHDVDRPVQRFRVDFRLRRGLALVDELDAALQVEAEARLFRRDHRHRGGYQTGDDEQDQGVAAAIGHSTVQTTCRASARARARRRRRRPGRCRPSRRRRHRVRRSPPPEPRVHGRPTPGLS